MPHESFKITSGVNTHETQAVNETGIYSSQNIRIKADEKGMILVEKIGGWSPFYATNITQPVVEIVGWEDTNLNKWIAYGTASNISAQLVAVQCVTAANGITTAQTNGNYVYNLSPTYFSDSVPCTTTCVAGSPTITVTDDVVNTVTSIDSVFFSTQVCLGGLVLQGQYSIVGINSTQYSITAVDIFGKPLGAAYSTVGSQITVSSASYTAGPPMTITFNWASPSYTFTNGEFVNVKNCLPTDWNGSWIVQSSTPTSVTLLAPNVVSTTYASGAKLDNFGTVPIASTTYTATGNNIVTITMPEHGYLVGQTFPILNQVNVGGISLFGNYIVQTVSNSYTFTISGNSSAASSVRCYLNSLSITGGTSTTSAVTLTFGNSSYTQPLVTTTSASSSTTTAVTLSWTTPIYPFQVGQTILVSGISSPSVWNGTFVVTGSTTTSVTYALSGTAYGSGGAGGSVINAPFNIGASINVNGILTPATWNGNFTVTGVTATSVTYALSGAALAWSSGGVISDIGGDLDLVYILGVVASSAQLGWGVGGWGIGGWGAGYTPLTSISGDAINASNWSLANYGQILAAIPIGFTPISFQAPAYLAYQPILIWDPTSNQNYPSVLTAGPPTSNGVLAAMPQRQLVAWGSSFSGIVDPLLVRWCDVNNLNVWVAQITNQAGSYRLTTGSVIIGAKQVSQQIVLWTDIGVWTMQYIGAPLVYSFNEVGKGCGLIGRHAAGVMNGVTYWMGPKGWFTLSGNGIQPMQSPVWDFVFGQLDLANQGNIVCATNSMFQEVSWYFPVSGGNGYPTAYVKYSTLSGTWDYGYLDRSAWIDNSVLGPPIGFSTSNNLLFQHEISPDANSAAMNPSFTTGYAAVADGDYKVFIDQWWPDFEFGYKGQSQNANVTVTFNAVDYPGQTPTTYGPYTVNSMNTFITPRIRARLLSITVSSSDVGTWFRMGKNRYRYTIDGKY
jgi:hypothetical protein